MDYISTNHINESIAQGQFPYCQLKNISCNFNEKLNFSALGNDALKEIKKKPEIFQSILLQYFQQSDFLNEFHQPESMTPSLNILINTHYNPEMTNSLSPASQQAIKLCPFITKLDRTFWLMAGCTKMMSQILEGETSEILNCFFYAILYILELVQIQECLYKKTLDFSKIDSETILTNILLSNWSNTDIQPYLMPLSKNEQNDIENLLEIRYTELGESFQKEATLSKNIGKETENEWMQFLSLLNEHSLKEHDTISKICNPSYSEIEKIKYINDYLTFIENDNYTINGKSSSISSIIKAVRKRFNLAPAHCTVSDNENNIFKLHDYAVELVNLPITFNTLLIVYHLFRLEPSKANAKSFCALALHCIKRNCFFVAEAFPDDSMENMILYFHQSFCTFITEHRNSLDTLSFDEVQPDSMFIGNDALNTFTEKVFLNDNSNCFEIIKNFYQHPDLVDTEKFLPYVYSNNDLVERIKLGQQRGSQIKTQSIARQAIVSLHIVYLFCDGLRIMHDNNLQFSYYQDSTLVDEIQSDLEHEMNQLTYKVYTKKAKIDRYRLENGINSKSISSHETNEEKLRNDTYIRILLNHLDNISNQIENLDPEALIKQKESLRTTIQNSSMCNLTEVFSDRFISINEKICNQLVVLYKQQQTEFEDQKKKTILMLGNAANMLPSSVLESLTTAELLFHKYANGNYANIGFDYSCISSLYFQAFEDAYNKLIWKNYSDKLNLLLQNNREHNIHLAPVYLPNTKYYMNKDKTVVHSTLTYAPFGNLFTNRFSEMDFFVEYFSDLVGFPNKQTMLEDVVFLKKITEFGNDIIKASTPRNEASHGGIPITIDQCTKDKITILHEMKTYRENSICLFHKLLYLMHNSPFLTHS